MPLVIADDQVQALARKLAEASRCSLEDAVKDAIERRLKEIDEDRAERRRRVDEILAKVDAEPDQAPGFTDKDLYDENGDPIY